MKRRIAGRWARSSVRVCAGADGRGRLGRYQLKKAIPAQREADARGLLRHVGFPLRSIATGSIDATGQVDFVRTGFVNAASYDFEGLTAEIAWRGEGARNVARAFAELSLCQQARNAGRRRKHRHHPRRDRRSETLVHRNITVDRGPVNVLWQTQYFGKSVWDADAASDACEYNGVGDWWLFLNASLGFDVAKNFEMRVIVDNVFDKAPPFPAPAANGTITYYSGILGRYFRLAGKVKF